MGTNQRNSIRVILLNVPTDNPMSFLLAEMFLELFFNMFLARSMLSSKQAVLRLPEFPLFLFRLVPCKWYFLMFGWIVLLQGGT